MALHATSGKRGLGYALAALTVTLWAALPIALKAVLPVMDAATITWYRMVASTALLGALLALRGRLPRLGRLGRGGLVLLLVATVFLAANYIAFVVALDMTTPADAQVVIQLGPLLLALGGLFVFRERFAGVQWLGLGILVIGLGLFFRSQLANLAGAADRYLLGNAIMLSAAAGWAIYGLAQKQLLLWLPSESIMVCIYAGCAVLFTPLASPASVLALDTVTLVALAFCALNTVVAYGAFAEALEHCEATRVSAVLALSPVVTLAFVEVARRWWPSLDLQPTALPWASLAGAGLVVLGSLATALGGERRLRA